MTVKNWLFFFVGILTSVIVGLTLFLYSGIGAAKDLIPSIITGVVTFAALFFSFLTNKEQREIIIATTVEKEWTEKVRLVTSEILRYTYLIYNSDIHLMKFEDLKKDILDNYIKLELLLDVDNQFQRHLFKSAFNITDRILKDKQGISTGDYNNLRTDLIKAAHNLFNTMKVK